MNLFKSETSQSRILQSRCLLKLYSHVRKLQITVTYVTENLLRVDGVNWRLFLHRYILQSWLLPFDHFSDNSLITPCSFVFWLKNDTVIIGYNLIHSERGDFADKSKPKCYYSATNCLFFGIHLIKVLHLRWIWFVIEAGSERMFP